MFYPFPIIKTIDDVLPAIKDRTEFIVAEKPGYMVVNYVVTTNDTFPPVKTLHDALMRECRGLIFDSKGKLIRRAYHKFFNLGEREELLNLDFSNTHSIYEKLDGSMVTPLPLKEGIRWATKMGITDTSMQAEVFVANNPYYVDFARYWIERDCTPIFEWCSNKNRIVLDYPEDRLILTAIRNNTTGQYYENFWQTVTSPLYQKEIPYVGRVVDSISAIPKLQDREGVVIRFHDGHMVKVKTEWYVRIHKNKELVQNERRLVDIFLANQLDDVKAFLPDADKDRIDQYVRDFMNALSRYTMDLYYIWKARGKDRKDFALNLAPRLPRHARGIVFHLWDKSKLTVDEVFANVLGTIRKHLASDTRFRQVKEEMFDGIEY